MALEHMIYFCAAHNNFQCLCSAHSWYQEWYCRCSFLFPVPTIQKNGIKGQPKLWHHLCLASASLHHHLLQCRYTVLWCHPVNLLHIHVLIQSKYLLIILLSFQHYSHNSFIPESSIPLCGQRSISILQNTQGYLTAIRLMHIENGFPDPTTNELLHLACGGICCQQSSSEHTRLPIAIYLLRTLKD